MFDVWKPLIQAANLMAVIIGLERMQSIFELKVQVP